MTNHLSYERKVVLLALSGGLPAVVIALLVLWMGDFTPKVQWTLTTLVLSAWIGFGFATRERIVRPLQTLSNLIAALAEGDFSIRARHAWSDEALGLAYLEVNQLTEILRHQRLGAVEATELLHKVMQEIDVAVFAFDGGKKLKLVNRAGAKLLGRPGPELLGQAAADLRLDALLTGNAPRLIEATYPGGTGRWELRRGQIRQEGREHDLLVLSDLSRTLREEERQAWKRLVRVLSHEINNSLTPIKSLSDSAGKIVAQHGDGEWQDDVARSLEVIGARADALVQFMQSYARLARLPPPQREAVDVHQWIHRVAALDTRIPIDVVEGPDVTVQADSAQLDQLLINLLANATDAALETDGGVRARWNVQNSNLELQVEDDGPGIAETANLFVPFYTTKPRGTGIGLVLSRQIAEAHGGTLTLANREDGSGCQVTVRIPL